MIRNLTVALALAATTLATPALAQRAEGPYLGVAAGVIMPNSNTVDVRDVPVTASRNAGYEFSALAGYDFGYVRTEVEGSYAQSNSDTIKNPSRKVDAFGGQHYTGVSANLLLDYDVTNRLSLEAGPMVGVRWYRSRAYESLDCKSNLSLRAVSDNPSNSGCRPNGDNGNAAFTYGAIAGVRYALDDNDSFGLRYKYAKSTRVEFAAENSNRVARGERDAIENHSVAAVYTHSF